MNAKEEYRLFLRSQNNFPIFFQDWWLDACCTGGAWDVALAKGKNGNILAVMPYFEKTYFKTPIISMPPFTPSLGPWYPDGTTPDLGLEHRLQKILLDQLPKRVYYRIKWMPQRSNWLAAYWQGFKQQTYYQHIIPELGDWGKVEQGLSSEVKRRARKASKSIRVETSHDIKTFYELYLATFSRQNIKPPVTFNFLEQLYHVLCQQNTVQLWCAKDKDQNWHAAQILIWDNHYLYSLASATHPILRNSGAYQLLVYTVLRELGSKAPAFNFAGSMIYNIAKMNEAFGARPVPYALITKYSLRFPF